MIHTKPAPGENIQNQFGAAMRIADDPPLTEVATHNIGNLQVGHTNLGQFGTGFIGEATDETTGEVIPSATFPANSNRNYLYVAAFWIGAIVGRDTLVSAGADDGFTVHEFWPGPNPGDGIIRRSIIPTDRFFSPLALSEQDIVATYYDTLTNVGITGQDPIDGRPHSPLYVKVEERSMQWSYSYASDFILFDYSIQNIGTRRLNQVYMGIYVDGDVHHLSKTGLEAYGDDICGFRRTYPAECNFQDTINLAYIMDNDGDPEGTAWDNSESVRDVVGVRLVRTPSDSLKYSFNWWTAAPSPDFGPRKAGTEAHPFRDMDGLLGAPIGDRNKYYMMSNDEFDYDQMFTAVNHTTEGWLAPPPSASQFAQGGDPKFMLSFGPFDIFPGEKLPISFAYVAGSDFHRGPNDFTNLLVPNVLNPTPYYESLDFRDFSINSKWASWIYDNPGVDTDGDLDFGKSRVCYDSSTIDTVFDTFYAEDGITIDSIIEREVFGDSTFTWYEGDGVPDFRGASPPPAPVLRVTPSVGQLTIRWNGLLSELTPDPFSNEFDFEGFRVYASQTNQTSDFVLQSSFDRANYNRYVYDPVGEEFVLRDSPFSLMELKSFYGPTFDPDLFGLDNPFLYHDESSNSDTLYYFSKQDYNADDLTDTTEIHKPIRYRYNFNPDGSIMTRLDTLTGDLDTLETPFPHTLKLDSAFTNDTFLVDVMTGDTTWYMGGELTEDGKHFKYFEYEYRVTNILPSVPLYVSVTAFDYGSPESGLSSLESTPLLNAVQEYPLTPSNADAQAELNVIVYPNPYRIDANYRASGYEGRGREDLPDERVRAVHFVNLPPVCDISIYSLDGDLVRTINHQSSAGAAQSMHASWDLVSRNTQPVVSGIYYFVVETPDGRTQIGKLVIIM